jgi:steroid 5-alpha reductase family enzyme
MISPEPTSLKNLLTLLAIGIFVASSEIGYMRFWSASGYEDFRRVDFNQSYGKSPLLLWTNTYVGFHVLATVMSFLGMIPIYFITQATEIESPLFYFGTAFTIGAVIIEFVSDKQLSPWKAKKRDGFIDIGLWRYSRHPNYLGEIMMWWGLYIMCLGTNGQKEWAWIGGLMWYLMFHFISIPMIEEHLLKIIPSYAIQQRRVSMLFPWFRNEKAAEEHKAKMEKST